MTGTPSIADIEVRLAAVGVDLHGDELRSVLHGVAAAPRPPPDQVTRNWASLLHLDHMAEVTAHLASSLEAIAVSLRQKAPPNPEARLRQLRDTLSDMGVTGFCLPVTDEHHSEDVPASGRRVHWLTNFSGSWGMVVITPQRAALCVDGRYALQAAAEVTAALYEIISLTDASPVTWAAAALGKGAKLGFDPRLQTIHWVERAEKILRTAGVDLVPLTTNPVDRIWRDRPPPPLSAAATHPVAFSGYGTEGKRAQICATLSKAGQDMVVLTQSESIAWLFNLRGGDVPTTPLCLATAMIYCNGRAMLFVDRRKLAPLVVRSLGPGVDIYSPDEFEASLAAVAPNTVVRVDPMTTGALVATKLAQAGAKIEHADDPVALPRAIKNPVEIEGARRAHRQDGAAMCRFLEWLDREALGGAITEQDASERLLRFRAESNRFRGASFETIAGSGANGAIIHYRATNKTNRILQHGDLLLIDSGGQYLDGTTDVTRTVPIGPPRYIMRRHYTLVLKALVALASLRFPTGTTGSQIDAIARQPLWAEGLDYDHGTGHGVGSYLGVHEGPQRISRVPSTIPLVPGMILSNEPGYYQQNAYGIRIETLILIREPSINQVGERPMLEFETLTLVPFDRRLILVEMLNSQERTWINAYHACVRETLLPLLATPTGFWLQRMTAPL